METGKEPISAYPRDIRTFRVIDVNGQEFNYDLMMVLTTVANILQSDRNYPDAMSVMDPSETRVMAFVANAAWVNQNGDVGAARSSIDRSKIVFEEIKGTPRSIAIMSLTQRMLDASSVTELAESYHALKLVGMHSSVFVAVDEFPYEWPRAMYPTPPEQDTVKIGPSVTYGDVFRTLRQFLEDRTR